MAPSSKSKRTMARTDLFFISILIWSIVSTTLLVKQFHRNTELERQLSRKSVKRRGGKGEESTDIQQQQELEKDQQNRRKKKNQRRQKVLRKNDDPLMDSTTGVADVRSPPNKSNLHDIDADTYYPFTRSIKDSTSSENFYVYVVQSSSSKQIGEDHYQNDAADEEDEVASTLSLEWSEVRWKDLVVNWDRNTTFSDVVQLSTPILENKKSDQTQSSQGTETKLIIHCLPKTASTTLRKACKYNMMKNCKHLTKGLKEKLDPYGYMKAEEFYHAVTQCPDVHQYCVQGGNADMTIVNYELEESNTDAKEREDKGSEAQSIEDSRKSMNSAISKMEPMNFVHLIPFRNFDDWAASALKQIYVADSCQLIDKLLDKCLGYRELYVELYPKSVLALQIGMALSAIGGDNDGNTIPVGLHHRHHFLLYNYKDTERIVTEISNFFGVPPMAKTDVYHKGEREPGTCPSEMLEKFHQCHDETLKNTDAIMDLVEERKRRRTDMKQMKQMLPPRKKKVE